MKLQDCTENWLLLRFKLFASYKLLALAEVPRVGVKIGGREEFIEFIKVWLIKDWFWYWFKEGAVKPTILLLV